MSTSGSRAGVMGLRFRTLSTATTLLMLATVVACSGGEGGAMTESSASEATAELKAAVEAYSDAFFAGEALGAYDLLSDRCRSTTPQDEYVANVVAFADLIGDARPEMTVLEVTDIDGERATVTYDYDRGDYGQSDQPWVLESGGWRYDDC